MSVEGMREMWGSYREGVAVFYEYARSSLREGIALPADQFEEIDPVLESVLQASEAIREQAEGAYEQRDAEEYEEATRLLLAAATVDAMLANDIFAIEPVTERWFDVLGESLDEVDAERQETLDDADAAFSGGQFAVGGGQPPVDLIDNVRDVTDNLVRIAAEPGREIVRGLANVATGGIPLLVTELARFDVITSLQGAVESATSPRARKRATKFLREHQLKLGSLAPPQSFLDDVGEKLGARLNIEHLLSVVALPERAKGLSAEAIGRASSITLEAMDALLGDFSRLQSSYGRQAKWIGRSARWVRRAGPVLSHFVAPAIGLAALGGMFFLGAGYLAYSLTDRLDARRLGLLDRVEGVVPLVERHIM